MNVPRDVLNRMKEELSTIKKVYNCTHRYKYDDCRYECDTKKELLNHLIKYHDMYYYS